MESLRAYVQIEHLGKTQPCPTIKRAMHYAKKHGTVENPVRVWKPLFGTDEWELMFEFPNDDE